MRSSSRSSSTTCAKRSRTAASAASPPRKSRASGARRDFLPKIKLEIAVSDELCDKVVESIASAANTGRIGDGKIFVMDLEHVMRIRTGETDDAAV